MKEHHRELLQELIGPGFKPRLSRTNGDHTRIEWDMQGKTYSITTSTTPSDRRSTLNARARIRRQLREAGVYEGRRAKRAATNGNGSALPSPLSLEERIDQLELDVLTLLDMLEERAPGSWEEGWNAAVDRVRAAFQEPPKKGKQNGSAAPITPPTPAPPPAQKARRSRLSALLLHMPVNDWLSTAEIAKRSGRTQNSVAVVMTKLKRSKLVDHDSERHLWRKRIEAVA